MSAPTYMPPAMVQNPELASIRQLLNYGKIVALIFWILGILWVLVAIVGLAIAATFGLAGAVAGSLVYPILFTILNLLAWMQIPHIETHVTAGQYAAAKDKTLIWGILEIIGGIVPGILLLIAYSKFDAMMRWQPAMAAPAAGWVQPQPYQPQPATPPAYSPAPAAAPAATPAAPAVAPAPAAAPAPPTTACPRCGGTATWIAQYNRWYCYSCQQYL